MHSTVGKNKMKNEMHISKGRLAAMNSLIAGCTKFFIGWIKRFGEPPILFAFPLNKKEHPNL
jgi:hypothetical protein